MINPRDHPGRGLVCICPIARPDRLGACRTCLMRVVAKMAPEHRATIYTKYPPMARQPVAESQPARILA